jgi:hypothetical protein
MAQSPKIRPRTTHINIKYHHFRQAVTTKKISIHAINTKAQLADVFTKPLSFDLFYKFRLAILGWQPYCTFTHQQTPIAQRECANAPFMTYGFCICFSYSKSCRIHE